MTLSMARPLVRSRARLRSFSLPCSDLPLRSEPFAKTRRIISISKRALPKFKDNIFYIGAIIVTITSTFITYLFGL